MDSSQSLRPSPSPRRELQGPRPTPLKVCKDSHKIKKPLGGPLPSQPAAPPPQHRPPVIIYTVSPKVIHTNPSDFMALVQRLTGSSSDAPDVPSSRPSLPSPCGAMSPAARLATYERTAQASEGERARKRGLDHEFDQLGIVDSGTNLDRPGSFPGILSPVPSSLPLIPPNFFSQAADPNVLSFMHEHSPAAYHGNKSFVDNTFLVSPNYNFLSSPAVPSPGAYWDLFNQYQDF